MIYTMAIAYHTKRGRYKVRKSEINGKPAMLERLKTDLALIKKRGGKFRSVILQDKQKSMLS